MNITIERAALLRSLGHVQSVVEKRTTIPILSNVSLKAANGELSLAATDMDLEIQETVPATVDVPGGITAPAHTLFDIVRKLQEGSQIEIKVEPDGSRMTIRSGRSQFRLSCLPMEDFPQLSSGDLRHAFSLPAADLRGLIDRTRFAVSTEETRYYLNGIYLHAARAGAEPKLRAVATDGHRLARVEINLPEGAGDIPGVIIPRKTVGEIRKLIDEAADAIQISLSDTKIRFAFDTVIITSKLIDGTFPDYERVIPTNNDKILDVDARLFAQAVDRVAVISTEKSRAVKLAVAPGVMTLSATSPEAGSAIEELEVDYNDARMEIGFNSRYLLDITQQIQGEKARLLLCDAASPTIARDMADDEALYVLMPMRV